MINDYYRILTKVSELSGKSEEEINRLVEAKRAKLSGLISREGALQIISSELGINFEKQKVKLNEIMQGMKKINTFGKIIRLFPVREFKKDNREGKVSNFVLADETANAKVVLWDTNHISLIENEEIKEGDFVEINNASLRNNEIHLTGFSEIKLSINTLNEIKTETFYGNKSISELKVGDNVSLRAFIVQAFEPKFFEICPECKKKVMLNGEIHTCNEHGRVVPERRALLSIILDDGTENLRAIAFSENIEKLGIKTNELESSFVVHRENLLGKEFIFSGNIRQNKIFNNTEFIITDAKDLEVDSLIKELEIRNS
jgi:ssDNA-binding replication factor A large subunit